MKRNESSGFHFISSRRRFLKCHSGIFPFFMHDGIETYDATLQKDMMRRRILHKSIFIVIYFARYTSREMERSDRLSRSTKYIRSIYFKEVKYIDFFIFIRISEIDILGSSICAQKQLRMRMKVSFFYIVSYIFMMIFLTFTCCQHGMSSSVSYSPSYICML